MNYTFFWHEYDKNGCFSNWYESKFIIGEFEYFCVEQYMMSQKALLFGDVPTNTKILRANTPSECKNLGKQVSPFDSAVWDENKYNIVKTAVKAKFSQNDDLRNMLIGTYDSVLAEASPFDGVWGIKLTADQAKNIPETEWPGENLLGKALMEVRSELLNKE